MEEVMQVLFEPVKFADLVAKNRVVMAPMVTNFAGEDDEDQAHGHHGVGEG